MRAMFRLRDPVIAICPLSEDRGTLVKVPPDAVIEVVGEPENSGLVDVLWDGRPIQVFMQDIKAHGDAINVARTG